jgi:hypothetical protein
VLADGWWAGVEDLNHLDDSTAQFSSTRAIASTAQNGTFPIHPYAVSMLEIPLSTGNRLAIIRTSAEPAGADQRKLTFGNSLRGCRSNGGHAIAPIESLCG